MKIPKGWKVTFCREYPENKEIGEPAYVDITLSSGRCVGAMRHAMGTGPDYETALADAIVSTK